MTRGKPKEDPRAATSVDRHIGARIRQRRVQIGKSQTTLAEELGITFQQIQKYEKGLNRVSAATLYRMTKALDANFAYFLPQSEVRTSTPALSEAEFVELGSVYSKLSTRSRAMLIAIARTFLDEDAGPRAKK